MTQAGAEGAYVAPDERVLDPTLLEKSAIERMPDPSGWRMLVLPYAGKGLSKGGLAMARPQKRSDAPVGIGLDMAKLALLACQNNQTI